MRAGKAARNGRPVQVVWKKRIDNSRLVRECDPGYLREVASLVAGALVCLAVVLLCAWQHFEFVHAGYQLEEQRTRLEQVLEWNRTLRLEQAALLDPMRIDLLARNRLGMDAPRAGQLLHLGPADAPVDAPILARRTPPGEVAAAVPVTVRRVSVAD